MKELKVNLEDKSVKKISQLSEYSKRQQDDIVSDLINTFCFLPNVVTCELLEYCIHQMEKCNESDQNRSSPFTEQRISAYSRISYFLKIIYNTQTDLIKKLEE